MYLSLLDIYTSHIIFPRQELIFFAHTSHAFTIIMSSNNRRTNHSRRYGGSNSQHPHTNLWPQTPASNNGSIPVYSPGDYDLNSNGSFSFSVSGDVHAQVLEAANMSGSRAGSGFVNYQTPSYYPPVIPGRPQWQPQPYITSTGRQSEPISIVAPPQDYSGRDPMNAIYVPASYPGATQRGQDHRLGGHGTPYWVDQQNWIMPPMQPGQVQGWQGPNLAVPQGEYEYPSRRQSLSK
jgi:hypothetical protein